MGHGSPGHSKSAQRKLVCGGEHWVPTSKAPLAHVGIIIPTTSTKKNFGGK